MDKFLQTGHKVEVLDDEEAELYRKYMPNIFADGIVRIYPENILLSSTFIKVADELYDFKFRPEDVVVAGYPKTGTTWLQEIVWTMLNNSNFDNPLAPIDLMARTGCLESTFVSGDLLIKAEKAFLKDLQKMYPKAPPYEDCYPFLKAFDTIDDHRVFKCHSLPTFFNPENIKIPKILYICRDPRDAMLSFCSFAKSFIICAYKGSVEEFGDVYINGGMPFGTIMDHLKAWKHFSKGLENIRFIYFEDLKANTMEEVQKLNEFLGSNHTKEKLEEIVHYSSFSEMKNRPSSLLNNPKKSDAWIDEETQSFFRQGKSGEHKKRLSPELREKIQLAMDKSFNGMDDIPYSKK